MPKVFVFILILLFCSSLQSAQDEYSQRRTRLLESLDQQSVALVSARSLTWGKEGLNKDFYFLTGLDLDSGVMMILPGDDQPFRFYGRIINSDKTVFSSVFPEDRLMPDLFRLLSSGRSRLALSFSDSQLLERFTQERSPLSMVSSMRNLDELLHPLRVIKTGEEIRRLRSAIDTTALALAETIRAVEPGMSEITINSLFNYETIRRGCPEGLSFSQVASGPNSTNVHFGASERPVAAGDLILFDVGAWYEHYTSDITRTIPVSGKFSPAQAEIYDLVLSAQEAAIARMIPGTRLTEVQKAAEDVLVNGLTEMGLMTDIASEWQKAFYIQHGFYHFIGLDVHDTWTWYRRDLTDKVYQPGMVMTMEPGLYFPAGMIGKIPQRLAGKVSDEEFAAFREKVAPVYEKYQGNGVRIEDDILITESGNEVLSAKVPKKRADIERLVRQKSYLNQTR